MERPAVRPTLKWKCKRPTHFQRNLNSSKDNRKDIVNEDTTE